MLIKFVNLTIILIIFHKIALQISFITFDNDIFNK
ncbi:hypothetical protein PSEHALCIP103_01344 [Pseudoalteromonas haloplanktis]|uniref:Uncharacterized protein n=1 Tax=Pseudoalteromonas haloplanktis TaxID=228 RepID=A0A9W4VYD4_PSEHA|nr:hypothetical protein PSEHALCIP103_01344 [Pseudoalteromonas haloplanktis]